MEREIKANGRSRVCLVRNQETGKRYIYRSFTGSGEVYHKMLGIDCPYLPKIHDVKEANGSTYVLEEYIQGDTLAFLLECKPLSRESAEQIIRQICQGLKVLHGIGAVHRDIKPENIILRGSDAVLIDFDASRLCKAENTTDTQIMGTTGYAAPEQYGFSQTDARADIYALGILLNEMLTKQHPSRQLAEGKFRPIIEKCTRINADQRYGCVDEFLSALNPPRKKSPSLFRLILVFGFLALICGGMLRKNIPVEEVPEQAEPQTATQMQTKPPTEQPTIAPTEAPTKSPKEPSLAINQWNGSTEGSATTFYYDLDGDGIAEQYIYGVDFLASPHENVVYYERCTFNIGEGHKRDIHCCVWQVNSDGSMNVAEGFTEILTDTEANIWEIDLSGDTLPVAEEANYKWPGAISVTFYPENAGSYMYEVVSYINDQKLTAQAPFTYVLRDSFS